MALLLGMLRGWQADGALAAVRRLGLIEERANRLVERLRERRVLAHVASTGVFQFGIRVVIPGGREAIWDNDGAAALEAQILQDGVLVGYVPTVPGSEDFDDDAVIDYIARMRYDDLA
jgi:hypothetical protein